jgi:hypothetical protein
MLVEPIFKNLLIHLCSFLVVMMDRNAVYFSTHERQLPQVSFCDFQVHFHNTVTIRDSLDDLYLGAQFCLSDARVLVGKPFHYQAPVASPFHHHDHWNKSPQPTTDNDCKALKGKVLFDHIFCRLSRNLPLSKVDRQ